MEGLSHLFDFNQSNMAKKLPNQKRHIGGLEAPRNSLELPVETSPYYSFVEDMIPVNSYQVTRHCYRDNSYPIEGSMKNLISEEISRGPKTRRTAPSVVARLMGMDVLPVDTMSIAPQVEKRSEILPINSPKKEHDRKGSAGLVNYNSKISRQMDFSFFHHKYIHPDRWGGSMKKKKPKPKPKPREHPQEEELQKFKKEFEAWRAARFRECSKVADLDSFPSRLLAQEDLNKEKINFYANSRRMTETEKHKEMKDQRFRSDEDCGVRHHGGRKELFLDEQKESLSLRSRPLSRDLEKYSIMNSDQKLDVSDAPTRIVILRPGPDRIGFSEESWASSSGTSEERGSIEDFLEEVKERLKCEMQGKSTKKGTMVRGGGIETPFSEKPSDTKQMAQWMEKHVRESLTRDLEMNLLRSESTRSYRSEIHFNGPGSPEFINKNTRKFLSDRFRNVLKSETPHDIPSVGSGNSKYFMLDNERSRQEKSGDVLNTGTLNFFNHAKDESNMQNRSFRFGHDDNVTSCRELSPQHLIRSLSAPVSGTSFGKLLLEDRHILTGAHIRRKHESVEKVTVDVKKHKRERFNIKDRVSSFKYSFTLKGRLFGRKIQSVEESHKYERDSLKDMMSGPTVVMNFSEKHENCTEVPPSPVSVCSSAHEDIWRPVNHLGPSPTSDPPTLEDSIVPQVFREISSNLDDLRRQLYELGTNSFEEKMIDYQPMETATVALEDQEEAYVRDLMVAAKLYDGSSEEVLSSQDPLAKIVSNEVFEEVEESYRKMTKNDEGSGNEHGEEMVDHKVLFDLLNEALSVVLGPPVTMSRFRKEVIGHPRRPPRGRELLDHVWEIIRPLVNHPVDTCYYLLDSMVARDLGSAPWLGLMNNEVDDMGKELETRIIWDLIEELVKDMRS